MLPRIGVDQEDALVEVVTLKAIARGTYVVNSCDITCAEGPFYNYEARFEFSKPRYFTAFEGTSTQLRRSGYLFTKMRVRFTGEWPRGGTSGRTS